jgi:ABC-2 type transport system ATP-binding protein
VLERVLGVAVQRSAEGGDLSVPVTDAGRAHEALGALLAEGIALGDFRMGQPSLDEVFFALTGGPKEARP